MYLKSIELQGFKSFAKKTKINFTEPITAIVGPNGSGKSNILDAITWALGETRVKSLRGAKMADVIFSGTHQRKALGIADVSLTFDNTSKWLDIPYNEVTIQRRMYRSGESEYRINQETCRLKDIQELFMDTGIGKDGYSFIGQGRIDAVLSNKPEDRRMVFEEAAGITKFKKRKNESIKKLQETLDNLERIQDLLNVLKKQELSLSDDLKRYYDYKEVYEKRKSLDEGFFVLEYQNFQARKCKVQELIQELSGEMDRLKEDLANKALSYQEISQELEEKEKDLDQDQEKLQEAIEEWVRFEEKRDRYEDQKRSIQASLDFDKNNITDLQASLLENQENLQTNQEDQEKSRQEEKHLEEKLLGQKNLVNEKKALLNNLVQKENQVKGSLESENQSKLSRDLRIQSMEGMIREGQARLEKLNSLSNQMDKEMDYLKGQIQEADQEIQEVTVQSKDQGQALEKTRQALLKNEEAIKEISESLRKMDLDQNELLRSQAFLQNTLDHYDGFNRSVKSFLKISKDQGLFQGQILGPLANLFQVDKKYELAMSVALGYALQNIVVANDSQVKDMIRLLKDRSLGRVTFLPLNRYGDYRISGEAPKESIGYARDFISCDDSLKNLFHQLLGDILFAESYDDGLFLSRNYRKKIISLKGDLFHPKGSITGGSIQKGSVQILNQKKKIQEKNQAIQEINQALRGKEALLKEKQEEKDRLDASYREGSQGLSEANDKILNLRQKAYSLQQNMDLQGQQKNRYQDEIDQMEADLKVKIADLEACHLDQEQDQNRLNLSQNLEEIQKEKNQASLELEEENEKLLQMRLQATSLKSTMDFQTNEGKRLLTDQEKINQSLDSAKKRMEENEKLQALVEEKLLAWDENYGLGAKDLELKKQALQAKKDFLSALNQKASKLNQEILALKEDQQARGEEIQKREFSLEKLAMEYGNLEDRFVERYGIIKDDLFKKEVQENPKAIARELSKLNKKIEEFGPLNERVVDEYQDLKERIDFQEKQKSDLIEAKEELDQVIENLDRKMRQVFLKSFKEITEHFSLIFKQLFRGGTANIDLEEGPVLEAGIDIKAQPPGKKLQSLSLLSGGERSLTAVALIFALLKYRPAPFCVLDEIDAALDDANIDRYVDYIRNLEDTQFMMITHRKPTMEIADILYGVTMEEKGISTIVPMKLKNI